MLEQLIAGGLGLVGGFLQNENAKGNAQDAQDFSADQYAKRWQTTVADMQSAGLNPMLAYSQGVGTSPSGVQAPSTDMVSPAVGAYINAANSRANRDVASAQEANIRADTDNKQAQADLIEAQAAQAWSSAGQSDANTRLIDSQAEKVVAEIKNIPLEGDRLRAAIINLAAQTGLTTSQDVKTGYETKKVLSDLDLSRAMIRKVLSEADLLQLDLSAARSLDNIGRESAQLKPLIDIIRSMIIVNRSK